MFGNSIFRNQTDTQAQVLAAQNYLDQARFERMEQNFEVALNLYDQAKVAFKDANQATPILSQLKRAFAKARTSQTPEGIALRQRIADVYYERAEVLWNLDRLGKVQASYRKALAWDSNEIEPASILPAVSLPMLGALLAGAGALTWAWWARSAAPTSMLLQPQSLAPMPLQPQSLVPMPLQQLPVVPAQAKSELVDYLFEKALSTLGSLEVSNKPSLFLIYAHDNPAYGQAEADTSKYLINKLSQIRVNLYSDQTPMGKPYLSSPEDLKKDGKLEDILTSQLCLLPDQLRDDVEPVDKVVVCCSELLGSYLGWSHYEDFYQELQKAYLKDREAYRKDGKQPSTSIIREVVRTFSQEEAYKAEFHHVLTEMAFLQIRAEQHKDQHGIIPISLTPNSYQQCLAHFIPTTTVRMEDILRFDEQAKAGREVYPNQGRHWVLFKLIERLLVGSDEVKTFLDKFWKGYSECISRLKNDLMLDKLEFAKFVDGIFGEIEAELHRKLVATVQQAQKQLPPTLSLADLRSALYHYYQLSNLSIQRVSGESISLDTSYINLAIEESRAQHEKEQETLKKQAAAFERLPSEEYLPATNPNKLISLEALFEPQQLRNGLTGEPKRILIQGRAGVGKTTLCKKLVYDYQHNTAWQGRFESVVWVPLRELKTLQVYSLEKLLCEHYFASIGSRKAQALTQRVLDHQDKTLFILDGLDEVVGELHENHSLSRFLKELLSQAQVVITSRPAGVDPKLCGQLDLELEIVGFSPDDVQTYIQKFAPESNKNAIQQFIQRTPLIHGLVKIPIQLDALCYSWDELPKDPGAVTMATLYQAMVDKLWRKDIIRLNKKEDGEPLEARHIERLSSTELEELMAAELHYLGYLAFNGLKNEKGVQIEFSFGELDQYKREFNKQLVGIKLSSKFTSELEQTSFLHTADAEQPKAKRHYHFLHFTFQEFFAAKFLVRNLQAYSEAVEISASAKVTQTGLGLMPSQAQLEIFIAQNKYNPRYEIVWWLVAGLLKSTALERFFTSLEKAPRDLIGGRHQQVMMGCLNEARTQLNKTTVDRQETELMQWLRFEMKLSEYGLSELGRQSIFPEHLLLKSLSQPEGKKERLIQTLEARLTLSDAAIDALIGALHDENSSIKNAAVRALASQKTLPEAAISALNNAPNVNSEKSKSAAAWIIGAQKNQPETLISHLIYKLKDKDKQRRHEAAAELSRQKTLPEAVIPALMNALQDEDVPVKDTAAWILGRYKTLPEIAISALIKLLQDENNEVRREAILALGQQESLSEETIIALTRVLKDEYVPVKGTAAWILSQHKTLPEVAISALIKLLQDENKEVRRTALLALGQQESLSESEEIIVTLTQALKDEYVPVKGGAAQVLGRYKTLPEVAISALIKLLQDENKEVRRVAIETLGQQESLSEEIIVTLTQALKDEYVPVKYTAAQVLGRYKTLSEVVISALIKLLQDENNEVRRVAIFALGQQESLSEEIIIALIQALKDEDAPLKYAAAGILGRYKTLPEVVISALIKLLQDEDKEIRRTAAQVLGPYKTLFVLVKGIATDILGQQKTLPVLVKGIATQVLGRYKTLPVLVKGIVAQVLGRYKTLPEIAISALIKLLQDEDKAVRHVAILALGQQESLSEEIIIALTQALKDKDGLVKGGAAQVLGRYKTLPEIAISALIKLLQDEDKAIRRVAIETLGQQESLSEEIIIALTQALKDKDGLVKGMAAGILGRYKTLPEIAISALIKLLQDEDKAVRRVAILALGQQESLSEEIIIALTQALKDEYVLVKGIAAQVLGRYKTLPEVTISALIKLLQDEDKAVRRLAILALHQQESLSESEEIIIALTQALKDEYDLVKGMAAGILGRYKTLPEIAISALIKLLQDEDKEIRRLAILALGRQESLSESEEIIIALTQALKDEDGLVKSTAAWSLSKNKILREAAVSALTDALHNEDHDVRFAAVFALGEQTTLPANTISDLIFAIKDEAKDVSSAAARALGWHLDRLYPLLPTLTFDQIQTLYMRVLFPQSCRQIAPLYIQDNQLHFYTGTGLGQPIDLTPEKSAVFVRAFGAVRAEAGIAPLPEEEQLEGT